MANYLSAPYQIVQPTSNVNVPLLATVLQAKQGRYDVAKSQIQQTIDAFGNLDLLRDSDKEYVAAKITDTISQLNTYGNRDLSLPGVADDILGTVKSVANDPNILNAIENTNKFRNFQAEVAQVKDKNKDAYSDTNYTYALSTAGVNDYLEGKTDKIGNLKYTNYSNYNKKLNDLIVDLESKKKDQTIQVPDGNGRMIETTISGLSPAQVRSIAMNMLDVNDKQQIKIDGWANSNAYDPTSLSQVSTKINSDIQAYNDRISVLNTKIKQGGSKDDKDSWQSELDNLATTKANLQKNLEAYTSNPELAATYMQTENVLNDVVERFAPLYTQSQKIVKDDIYWAQKNYELDQAKFQYEQAKDAKKEQKDLGLDNLIVSSTGLAEGEIQDNIQSAETEIDNRISTINTNLSSVLEQYKTALEGEASSGNQDAQNLLTIYNNRLANKKSNQSDLDIFRSVITETDSTNDSLEIIGDVNYKSQIRGLVDEADLYITGRNAITQQSKISHIDSTLNTDETFKAFYNNPETKMLWRGKDGKERAYPVRDVLMVAGLMDRQGNKTGDIKAKPDLLKALENSYYADEAISKGFSKALPSLQKLARSLGENPTDVLKAVTTEAGNRGRQETTYTIQPNTKTYEFIMQAQRNGVYDTFGFADNSLSGDDNTIGRFLRETPENTEAYRQGLQRLRDKLPNNQIVGIQPSQETLYQGVQALATSVNPQFKPSKESTLNIRDAGEYVEISTTTFTTQKGANVANPSAAKVLKTDFQRNFPELTSRINLNSKAGVYTLEKLGNKPLISPPIQFLQSSATPKYEWATEVLLKGKETLAPYLTDVDTKVQLQRTATTLISSDPAVRTVINEAVDNSSNFGVNIELSNRFGTPKLYIKLLNKKTGDLVHSQRIDNLTSADDFKEVLDNAPQVYYGMLINDILTNQTYSQATGNNYPAYEKLKQNLNIQ